jgi:hypothetical protein
MNLFDLDDLNIVVENPDPDLCNFTNFYDLTQTTFKSRNDVGLNFYYVSEDEEMRIDLICNKIYQNTDYIDIILNINMIDNPLNISAGTLLLYPAEKDIELYRVTTESQDTVSTLLNINKAPKTDPNRSQYIENSYSLPPTVLPNPVEPIQQSGNNIIIGGGLFS